MRASAIMLVVALLPAWLLLAVSCETGSGPGRLEYDTPEGDEVAVSCPVHVRPLVDPTVDAEMRNFPTASPEGTPREPGSWITPVPRETRIPSGSLGALFPVDPITGELPPSCVPQSNAQLGSPFGGFFANEAELDGLGRLCGCDVRGGGHDVWRDYFKLRADLYLTTPGAREAFTMEARTIEGRGFEDVEDVDEARLASIGDERTIRLNVGSINGQRFEAKKVLLVRWHNIIARMELSPQQPTDLLLDYAAQLGRNIEAVASGSGS
jgi:hypothetical protein